MPLFDQHPPIHIEGDLGFLLPGSGVTGGFGTEADPYVISGWLIRPEFAVGPIDLSDDAAAIRVENTRAHYRIEDVTIEGEFYRGIHLSNSDNVEIVGTRIHRFGENEPIGEGAGYYGFHHEGIAIEGSQGILLSDILVETNGQGVEVDSESKGTPESFRRSDNVTVDGLQVRGVDGGRPVVGVAIETYDANWSPAGTVALRNVVIDNAAYGLQLRGISLLEAQNIAILDTWGSYGILLNSMHTSTLENVTVTASEDRYGGYPIVLVRGEFAQVTLRGVLLEGGLEFSGALPGPRPKEGPATWVAPERAEVILEDIVIVSPRPDEGSVDGIRLRDITRFSVSNAYIRDFPHGLRVSLMEGASAVGHMESVVIESPDLSGGLFWGLQMLRPGTSLRADDVTVRGASDAAIGLAGPGPFELSNLTLELGEGRAISYVTPDESAPLGVVHVRDSLIQSGPTPSEGPYFYNLQEATVTGTTFVGLHPFAVAIQRVCQFAVVDNDFVAGGSIAIDVVNSPDAARAEDCGAGSTTDANRIEANRITGSLVGIRVATRTPVLVLDNVLQDQIWHGMEFLAMQRGLVSGNVIENAGRTGIWVLPTGAATSAIYVPRDHPGPPVENAVGNTFTGNRIDGSGEDGMVLGGIDNVVENNAFAHNAGYGLRLRIGEGNIIGDNVFVENGLGDFLDGRWVEGSGEVIDPVVPTPGLSVLVAAVAIALLAARRRGVS